MVVNFLPLCLAEADIKQTNDSFWKIKNIFLQCLEQDVPWFMSTCVLVDFMPCLVSDKSSLTRILSRISFCEKRVTIVNHWSSKLEKPLKNHRCQWLSRYHSINGDGENFQKPSPFHRWRKKTITIPSPWKIDHRSGLNTHLCELSVKRLLSELISSHWCSMCLRCRPHDISLITQPQLYAFWISIYKYKGQPAE